mgnify:FL=1
MNSTTTATAVSLSPARKNCKILKIIVFVLSLVFAVFFGVRGLLAINEKNTDFSFDRTETFTRVTEAGEEEYEDETLCPVEFRAEDGVTLTVNYTYEEWESLPGGVTVTGYVYTDPDGNTLAFDHEATDADIASALKNLRADEQNGTFGAALALLLLALGLSVMIFFDKHFTAYEQIWFLTILAAASIVSVLFPEGEVNGISGIAIMALYLADTFLNILCELLISKQSKWNFLVSVLVELCEIAICVVLAYRFATMATTLFFWLPCDIISFVNWHRHPDKVEEELTQVRTLKGWQEVAIIAGVIVFTFGVGYFLTTLDFGTDLFGGNRTLEVIVCYADACASAVGVVNGIFILLRLREQWIAWYISALLEALINILSGQIVLLVLKIGYLTNTTYGYIRWTKYIKQHEKTKSLKSVE